MLELLNFGSHHYELIGLGHELILLEPLLSHARD